MVVIHHVGRLPVNHHGYYKFNCPYCDTGFISTEDEVTHVKVSEFFIDKRYVCPLCRRSVSGIEISENEFYAIKSEC